MIQRLAHWLKTGVKAVGFLMFMASLFARTKTPLGFKAVRRRPYFLFGIKSPASAPSRLLRGLNRVSGRGLGGTQTIFSKAS